MTAARPGRTLRLTLAVLAGAAVTGLVVSLRTVAPAPAPPGPVAAPHATSPAVSWSVAPTGQQAAIAPPVRVRIPAIGVDSSITDITINKADQLVPPATTDIVGWYIGGPAPGDTGPALLAAHVDSRAGPGVFFRLVELRPGDAITVDRADHTTVEFVVVSSTRVAKAAFPTDLVYAPVPVPLLRLITCGGAFDHSARSYRDNIIVEAAQQ